MVLLNVITYIITGISESWFFPNFPPPRQHEQAYRLRSSSSRWRAEPSLTMHNSPVSTKKTNYRSSSPCNSCVPHLSPGPGSACASSTAPRLGTGPCPPTQHARALFDRRQVQLHRAPHALHSWERQRLLFPQHRGSLGAPLTAQGGGIKAEGAPPRRRDTAVV